MNISTNTIVKKLAKEVEGLSTESNPRAIHEAMHNIHLISGLWLEEYKSGHNPEIAKPANTQDAYVLREQVYKEQSNDDTSIFDF